MFRVVGVLVRTSKWAVSVLEEVPRIHFIEGTVLEYLVFTS